MLSEVNQDSWISVMELTDDYVMPIANAEASLCDNDMMFYFNRLFVHKKYRQQGYGTKVLSRLLEIISERNLILQLDINPYGDMDKKQLESFYMKHGFVKKLIKDNTFGSFYTQYFYGGVEMDLTKLVDGKIVATVLKEQTFWVGQNSDIEIVVNLYEHNGSYFITSLLNGIEECNTEEFIGSIDDETEVITQMEKLVNDNIDYILSLIPED